MQNNTVINLQLAFFLVNTKFEPDILANRINSRMKQFFDIVEPHTIKIPNDIFGNMPLYEMRTANGEKQVMISQGRIDVGISPNLLSQKSISNTVQNQQNFVYSLFEAIEEERKDINRLGVILSVYGEQEHPGEYVSANYCEITRNNIKEASLRINNTDNVDGYEINNVFTIADGTVNNGKLGINQFGAIITRDINNVPNDKRFLTVSNMKNFWRYALKQFTDDRVGRI